MKKSAFRHSIKMQFALTFICLMTFCIGLYWIINTLFLQKYYMSSRQKALMETYYEIDDLLGDSEELTDEQKQSIDSKKDSITSKLVDKAVEAALKYLFGQVKIHNKNIYF